MEKITTAAGLKNAIQLLEIEQAENGKLLKEQLHFTIESFRPVNILKRTLKNLASSPCLITQILGAATGLVTGYISKKTIGKVSGHKAEKLLDSVLQYGIVSVFNKHQENIKILGLFMFQRLFGKREKEPFSS
ncbi:MAG: hypothetical protein JXB49_15195 [Bacteroidales bacterium]|nr:hypothetical protein [Bacteroidales bacterium]